MIDNHEATELFKIFIESTDKHFNTPEEIIEAYDNFKKLLMDKDREHRKTRAYSEDI